jgi:hypothetical protein
MVAKLTSEFLSVPACTLVFDESSDAKERQFLDLKAHHCNGAQYRAVCIRHLSLADVPADAIHLAESTRRTFQFYGITTKADSIVSDTASLMPATRRDLKRAESPCWPHVRNLMLKKIVTEVKKQCLSLISRVARTVAVSTKWRKRIYHNQTFRLGSLGIDSAMRWYSLWKLPINALAPKEEVRVHIGEPWASEPEQFDAVYGRLTQLDQVVTTFESATETLESETFGSLSFVNSCLFIIGNVWIREAEIWEPLAAGWSKAYDEYWLHYLGDGHGLPSLPDEHGLPLGDRVLLAAALHPVIILTTVMGEELVTKAWSLLREIWTARCSPLSPAADVAPPRPSTRAVRIDGAVNLADP